METEDILIEAPVSQPIWDGDEGDMTVMERTAFVLLVRHMFVTKDDSCWDAIVAEDAFKLHRDLCNLGLELVVDERLGVAWARQVSASDRGKIPAARHEGKPEKGHVAHVALCLRRHWDDCEMRGETDPHVTLDEIRSWVEQGPLASDVEGDGEKLDKVCDSIIERLRRVGLIRRDVESGTWRVLPTILVLVNDAYCESVINNGSDE